MAWSGVLSKACGVGRVQDRNSGIICFGLVFVYWARAVQVAVKMQKLWLQLGTGLSPWLSHYTEQGTRIKCGVWQSARLWRRENKLMWCKTRLGQWIWYATGLRHKALRLWLGLCAFGSLIVPRFCLMAGNKRFTWFRYQGPLKDRDK